MMAMDAADLLQEIVALGLDTLCRPTVDFEARRERGLRLRQRVDAEAKTGTHTARYFDGFAPMLLTAIGGSIKCWSCGDAARGEKFDDVLAGLIPKVRADGGAVIELVREDASRQGGVGGR